MRRSKTSRQLNAGKYTVVGIKGLRTRYFRHSCERKTDAVGSGRSVDPNITAHRKCWGLRNIQRERRRQAFEMSTNDLHRGRAV